MSFIDNAGFITYEEFLKLPSALPNYIIAIRYSESLIQARRQLSDLEAKDQKSRKKLSDIIKKLEAFFR